MAERFLPIMITAFMLIAPAPAALAQATANAVTSAEDAFGTTQGSESVGIYTESSVRGFDLEAAGNYRVNGRYFVKTSGVSTFFIERTDVRIGYSTLSLDFPGPSGVVDYRLRDPERGEPSEFTLGLDVYEQPYVETLFKHRNEEETFSGALGVRLHFDSANHQGGRGHNELVAGVFRFSTTGWRIQAFGGDYKYDRKGLFKIAFSPGPQDLPDRIQRGQYLGQDWAIERGQSRIAGLLADIAVAPDWRMSANGVFSQDSPKSAFAQIFTVLDTTDTVSSTIIASPPQRTTSYSGELSLTWLGVALGMQHDLAAHGRARTSSKGFGGELAVELNDISLGASPPAVPSPELDTLEANLKDEIDQRTFGVSWQARSDRLRINAGVLHTDYSKTFIDSGGKRTANTATPLLYNFGAAFEVLEKFEIYGSYSRSIEEAGVAPVSTSNPNAVLPAGISTQTELGMRYHVATDLYLVLAGFDTSKPLPGINVATDAYELIGEVRHRGAELSFSGSPAHNISIVAGGVYTDASVAGVNVESGIIARRPVGVPEWRLIGNVDYEPFWAQGLSFDVGLQYIGEHAARSGAFQSGTQLTIPPSIIGDAGLRYDFNPSDEGWTIRAQLRNVADVFNWEVSSAETLEYISPRAFRLVLTRTF